MGTKYTIRRTINPFIPKPVQYTIYADGKPVKMGFSSVEIARRYVNHLKDKEKEQA